MGSSSAAPEGDHLAAQRRTAAAEAARQPPEAGEGGAGGGGLPGPRLQRVGRALLVLAAAYWALSSGAGEKLTLEDLEPRKFRPKPTPPSRHLVWLSQVGFGFGLGFWLFIGGGG